jgi:beta-lactamase class A
VLRRVTIRRAGRWQQRGVLSLAVGLLVLTGIGVGWAVNPFATGAKGVVRAPVASGDSQQTTQQMDDAALPTPDAGAAGLNRSPTLVPTLRQWEANANGIRIDPALASRLDPLLNGVDGHLGVVVKDLGSGRGAVLNGDLELQSASLYKLPILYTVFDLGLNMSEELTISDEALSYDAGTMELTPGETLSVAEALERMVTLSDNTSAIMLASRVGAGHIESTIAGLGMDTTHYSLERMTTSAWDIAHFMELVADSKAVSPAASADMLHLMLRQRVNDRLPRLLPDNVQVAHKTGNLPGVVNDAGILYGPGSTVVVAMLVSETTDEAAAAAAIAQVGATAYTYFEDEPEVAERPTVLPAPARPIPPVVRESHPLPPTPAPTLARVGEVMASPTPVPTADRLTPAPTLAPTRAATVVPTLKPTAVPPTPTPKPPAPTATPVPPTPTRPLPPATAAVRAASPTVLGPGRR